MVNSSSKTEGLTRLNEETWKFNGDLPARKLTQLCFLTHESRLNFATTPFVIFQFAMLNCQSAPSIKNWEPSEIWGAKHQHPEKQKNVQWIGWKACRKPTHLIFGGPRRAVSFLPVFHWFFNESNWVKLSKRMMFIDFPCIFHVFGVFKAGLRLVKSC